MRYFITGDKHGNLQPILDFIKKYNLGIESNIIVLGDIGLVWRRDERDYRENIKKYEEECNGVHLYWICGNHENFDIIKTWDYNRNYVYDNSTHIHYCPRGFEVNMDIECGDHFETKRALFLGGADSVDKWYRTEHLDWWKEEQITEKDISKVTGYYDYIFTHCCPYSVFKNYSYKLITLPNIEQDLVDHTSEKMLDKVAEMVDYGNWWFGHYHIDEQLDDKHRCIFNDFIEL